MIHVPGRIPKERERFSSIRTNSLGRSYLRVPAGASQRRHAARLYVRHVRVYVGACVAALAADWGKEKTLRRRQPEVFCPWHYVVGSCPFVFPCGVVTGVSALHIPSPWDNMSLWNLLRIEPSLANWCSQLSLAQGYVLSECNRMGAPWQTTVRLALTKFEPPGFNSV